MVDCSIVVVAYRSADDLPALLDAVPEAVGALSYQVTIVDNDPEGDLTPIIASRRHVALIRPAANLGYSGGINRGMAAAPPSRFTVILNPDLTLAPGAIARLAAVVERGGAVASVPLILGADGTKQPSLRREPSVARTFGEALFGDRWSGRPDWLAEMVRDRDSYTTMHRVDWATGAALLVRTEVAERVGEWDASRFFLYSEETDYCRRLRDEGIVEFVPDAVVQHRGAGSGSSPALDALREVNKLRYFRKWHDERATALFAAGLLLHHALRLHHRSSRAALAALVSRRRRATLPGGPR